MLNPAYRAIIVDHEEPFVGRLQLLQELRTALPGTPVIVSGAPGLDNPHRVQIILRYFEYGAAGYVCVDDPCERLAGVLTEVTRGESFVEPPVALELLQRLVELRRRLKRADPYIFDGEPEELTPRQLEVLALVATGCTNQEIAEQLAISVGTVKNHVHGILESLKVSSREAAAQAYRAMQPAEITMPQGAPASLRIMTS
jgi:DNA-binding NarL/FixJ family response regulator